MSKYRSVKDNKKKLLIGQREVFFSNFLPVETTITSQTWRNAYWEECLWQFGWYLVEYRRENQRYHECSIGPIKSENKKGFTPYRSC